MGVKGEEQRESGLCEIQQPGIRVRTSRHVLNHTQRSDCVSSQRSSQNAHCPPESLLAPCSHLIITKYTLLLYGYLYYTAVSSLFSSALPLVSIPQCSALIREQSEQKPSWAAAIQQLSPLPLWHCRLPFTLLFCFFFSLTAQQAASSQ